jgi:hypothetical protein
MKALDPTPTIWIQREVGPLLMLRSSVTVLFDKLASVAEDRVVLDFSNVEFMSRSFADEYLTAKKSFRKRVEEQHLPYEVSQMLKIVGTSSASPRAYSPGRIRSSVRPQSALL